MAKLNEELLHKYQDGELKPSEAQRIGEQIRSSTELGADLDKMKRLGDLLRLMSDELLSEVSFEGFAERVTAGVRAQSRPSFLERLSVASKEFFEYRRQVWIPAVCAAAAVLAVVLSMPFLSGSGSGAGGMAPVWTASADGGAAFGSRIEEVSFGDMRGTVYQIDDSRGGTTGVVWIVE